MITTGKELAPKSNHIFKMAHGLIQLCILVLILRLFKYYALSNNTMFSPYNM